MDKTKTILSVAALAALMLAPAASANVVATFVGSEEHNSRTKITTYEYSGLHYTEIIDVPDAGRGTFTVDGFPFGSCIFATGVSCISGTFGGTLMQGQCSPMLGAESQSFLVGGFDSAEMMVCNNM